MAGYWQNLEARNWVPGGNVVFNMDGLPPQTRVRGLQFIFDLQGTKATGDVLAGDQFAKILTNLKLSNFVNIGGYELTKLNWVVNGHVVEDPKTLYSVVAGATTFRLYCVIELLLRDVRSPASDDASLPTEMIAARGAELTLANANVFGGTIVLTSGIIRCCVERIHETNVPMLTRVAYNDASSQTIRLEAGLYKDIILCKQDGTALSNTDVVSVDVIADGRPILQNVRFEQLVSAFNRTGVRNVSGGRGELLRDAAEFLPLVWHDNSGKSNITKQVLAEKDLLIQINGGTLQTPRVVYWKAVAKDGEVIASIAKTIGMPEGATAYEPAVASKTPPQAAEPGKAPSKKVSGMFAYLPGKFRTKASAGNKLAQ